eukprot:3946166-Pyramimonas_sp.AAC.1
MSFDSGHKDDGRFDAHWSSLISSSFSATMKTLHVLRIGRWNMLITGARREVTEMANSRWTSTDHRRRRLTGQPRDVGQVILERMMHLSPNTLCNICGSKREFSWMITISSCRLRC